MKRDAPPCEYRTVRANGPHEPTAASLASAKQIAAVGVAAEHARREAAAKAEHQLREAAAEAERVRQETQRHARREAVAKAERQQRGTAAEAERVRQETQRRKAAAAARHNDELQAQQQQHDRPINRS